MQAQTRWPDACRQLTALYQQWQVLTEAEGQAIGTQDWLAVEERQAAKRRLQQRISAATEALRVALAGDGVDPAPVEQELQRIIAELIGMESANRDLLGNIRERTLARLGALDRTALTLRRVRRAYGGGRLSAWQTYS